MGTLHPMTFAALLRRFRRVTGLTQAELAEKAGLSPEAVSALERGVNRTPRRETVDLLAEALGLEGQERTQFEQAARRRGTPTSSPHLPVLFDERTSAPLVGRGHDLAQIEHLLGDRSAPMLLLAGEPGIGMTRLLREAATRATDAGWIVLMGSCPQTSFQNPYAPLLGMIERDIAARAPAELRVMLQGCAWLVRLLPELAERDAIQVPAWTLEPDQERRLMFAAVAHYLSNIAGTAGVLLVLDDLQWAGSDACDLLATLVRMPATTPLRVLGSYTATEKPFGRSLAATITELEHEGLLHQRTLNRLTESESEALLREMLPGGDEITSETRQRVVAQCGGIPFYLVSWAQALASGTLSEGGHEVWPGDVMQSIRRRIALQPEGTAEVLQVMAVAGGKVAPRLLRDVLQPGGRSEDDVVAALEAASHARLLDETDDGAYQFANMIIRDVVAHDLSAARRTTLHRRLAEALEGLPGEPRAELLAFHYVRADEPEKAVRYLSRAGDRAVGMRAYAAAEAAYGELVGSLDRLGRTRDAAFAREKWGKVLCVSSRYDQSLEALDGALNTWVAEGDAEAQTRVLVQIGQVYADRGAAREGLQRLAPVLSREAAPGVAPQTLAALHDVYAQLLHLAGQYREQLAETERAANLARDANDAPLVCQIQMRRGNALRMLGEFREAIRTLEEVIVAAESIGDPHILSQALENVSVVYLLQGEFDRSRRYVERALQVAEQLADPLTSELLLWRRGLNDYAVGNWQQARVHFENAQKLAQQVGPSWVSPYIMLGPGQLLLAQGDLAAGDELLNEAAALAKQAGDLQALRWSQTALAERDLLVSQPDAARERLEPLLDRPGQREGLVTYLLPFLAWASLDLGKDKIADEQLHKCLTRATREHIRLAQLDAVRVQVMRATRRGEFVEAERLLDEGLHLCAELSYPYGEAKLIYAGGLAAQAAGENELARERLTRAQAALSALGEGLYLPHVERALASLP